MRSLKLYRQFFRPSRNRLRFLLLGTLVTVVTLACMLIRPNLYVAFENRMFDLLAITNDSSTDVTQTAVVAIDDRSLAKFGQWPWSRNLIAQMIDTIGKAGADAVVVDLFFPEPDRTSPIQVQHDLLNAHSLLLDFNNLPLEYLDHDQQLANSLNRYPTVLAYQFLFGPTDEYMHSNCLLHPIKPAADVLERKSLFEATGALCNIPVLSQASRNSGFVNVRHDADGVLRRVPMLMSYGENLYPSLGIASVVTGKRVQNIMFERSSDGLLLDLDMLRIPFDTFGNIIPRFSGVASKFAPISAVSVLQGNFPADAFHNKIVVIGITATGLSDNHVTPVGREMSGLEIQATALENMLSNRLLCQPIWGRGAEFAQVVFLGFLSAFLVFAASPTVCILAFIVGVMLIWIISTAFWSHGFWISPLGTVLVLGINLVFLNVVQRWKEERRLRRKHLELVKSQDVTIMSLIALAETRDPDTGAHIKRTRGYVRILAEGLAKNVQYASILTPDVINLMTKFAPLHDIGKVGVPDQILLKPGELTEEEFERIKEHTTLGYDALQRAEKEVYCGDQHPFLSLARDIAYSHHERWDGTGYPLGLAGYSIPLGGRLMALADVYDALISPRVYKSPVSHTQAVTLILEGRGSQFDPDVVDVFLESEQLFAEISLKYS